MLGEHGFQFVRRAGQKHDEASRGFEPQAGRRAARIFQQIGAFGNHGLAFIDFGHGAAQPPEAGLDALQNAAIQHQFAAEQVGDGFAREIVQRGAQAAGRDHQFDAVERAAEGVANVVVLVADHGFAGDGDAQMVEPLGEEKRVGIDAVGREQFRADGDDFSLHLGVMAG